MKVIKALSVATAALLIGLAITATAAPAAPQGPWILPAVPLTGNLDVYEPDVVFGPNGTAIVIWNAYDEVADEGVVLAATRPPGGNFGTPVPISGTSTDIRDAQISVGPDGTAAVVWASRVGSEVTIQATTRPPGGSFATPVDISTDGEFSQDAQVAVGADGKATVVWAGLESTNYMIESATGNSASGFSEPITLSDPGQTNETPQVSVGADGTAAVTWSRYDGTSYRIQAAVRGSGSAFASATDVSTLNQGTEDPHVAVDPAGRATVVWMAYALGNTEIQQSTRPLEGTFSAPALVSPEGKDSRDPEIDIGANGTDAITWYGQSDNLSGMIVQASIRAPGGTFGEPAELSADGDFSYNWGASVGPDGTTTVLFSDNGADGKISAATRPPGGSFGPAVKLASLPNESNRATVAVGPLNQAIAVWDNQANSYGIKLSSTELPSFSLAIGFSNVGGVTVTSDPSGINCDSDCSASYPAYSKVTLIAKPVPWIYFVGWGGPCLQEVGNTCVVEMTRDLNVNPLAHPEGRPAALGLRITRFSPRKPVVKKLKVVKVKVTAINDGILDSNDIFVAAKAARLCVTPTRSVKKVLKLQGKGCFGLGDLAEGNSSTRTFRFKATGKAKTGRSYKLNFVLTAKGVKTAKGAVSVKVK